jgi:small conductance mechanosensitive channel
MMFNQVWGQLTETLADLVGRIPFLIVGVIVFVVFHYLAKGARRLTNQFLGTHERPKNLQIALERLGRWTILLTGVLVALLVAFPGFSVGQLVQLLGISGLALGIAFRDIFEDFVAGILLLLEEPFRIGDQIVIQGFEGTIESIEARATSIRTYDGRRVIIPNADLFTDRVTVNTAYESRRIEYDVGIGYGDDADRARELVLQALRELEGILQDPAPDVLVMELADYSVVLRVRWWIKPPRRADALDSRDRVLAAVKHTLLAHGFDLPFPTQQVLFHDQTEEGDGDRARQREGWPAGEGAVPRPHRMSDAILGLLNERARDDQVR